MAKPKAPSGLAKAGKSLWNAILGDLPGDWELDARELHLLARACGAADHLAELEAAVDRDGAMVEGSRGQLVVNPALCEARQLEIVQLRLLGAIQLPDADSEPRSLDSRQAQRAADIRWGRAA